MAWFRKKKNIKEIEQPTTPNGLFLLPRTKYDYAKEVGTGLGSNVIMSPIQWVMRTFPESDLKILKGDGEELEKHPMLDLMETPNEFYNYETLIMATLLSWNIAGNAYWLKVRNGQGVPEEIWYIPHWMMKPKSGSGDKNSYIDYYEYTPVSEPIRKEREDVIHFRFGLDPENIRLGLSPLASGLREIFTDDEASNFSAAILKNMGIPGVVISPDGEVAIDVETAKEMKEKYKEIFGGDSRGEAMIMTTKTHVQQFGFNPNQLKLSDIRNISEERVCALLGIPSAVVGFGSGLEQTKVGATMRELIKLAWSGNIIPTQRILAKTIQTQLLAEYGEKDYNVVFDNDNVHALEEDKNEKIARLNQGVLSGWVKVSEAREAEGLPVTAEDEIYLRPVDPFDVSMLKEKKQKTIMFEQLVDQSPRVRPNNRHYRLARLIAEDMETLSKAFRVELIKVFDYVGEIVENIAKNYFEETQKNKKDYAEDKVDAESISQLVPYNDIDTRFGEVYSTQYSRIATATLNRINTAMELGISLPEPRQARIVTEALERYKLLDIRVSIKKNIFDMLGEGRAEGESVVQLARRIRDKVGSGRWSSPKIRAQVIARTETAKAQNIAMYETYREASVEEVIILDARLGATDEDCQRINGLRMPIDRARAEVDDEHPNGTRMMVPIVPIIE